MRFSGTLTKWNPDRGFGFVVAEQGTQELFVHVSAFPRDGRAPTVGEVLSFEMELDNQGRKRAVRLRRPGAAAPTVPARPQGRPSSPPHRVSRRPKSNSFASRLIGLGMVAALGGYGYTHYEKRVSAAPAAPQGVWSAPGPATVRPATAVFQCDGRKRCSQMTSCEEATFFLKNCPGTEMDGDRDGIPCEQQHC
jgi:cold shock CspA family protein